MPKKSKSEKSAAADKRRHEHMLRLLAQTQGTSYRRIQSQHHQATVSNTESAQPAAPSITYTDEDLTLRAYFTRDLKKSVAVIALIIALEIALYYGTMYSYLGTILRFGS